MRSQSAASRRFRRCEGAGVDTEEVGIATDSERVQLQAASVTTLHLESIQRKKENHR